MERYWAAHALLPDGACARVHAGVALDVDTDGYIAAVTPGASPGDRRRLEGLVLPGMVNLHSHGFQRAMAGLAERRGHTGDSFWTWREAMYALVERLTPEAVAAVTAQAYLEMLRAGYTHVAEFHYLHNAGDGTSYDDSEELAERVREARAASGIGLTLLPTLYRFAGFDGRPAAGAQRRFARTPDAWARGLEALAGRAEAPVETVGAGLHSLRAVGLDDLRTVPDVLASLPKEAPVHIHVAEQVQEVADCRAKHGTTPLDLLLTHAPVDARWCLIHATQRAPGETERLAASGAVVGLCPTTEANLGDGLFELEDYAAAGGAWGIGSDSQVGVDPAAELRLLESQARLRHKARNVLATEMQPSTGAALYAAAAEGGARAAGLPLGRLAPGCRADFVVLDLAAPGLLAAGPARALDAWIFAGGGGGRGDAVRDVCVAGRWVLRAGHHDAADAIAARFRAALSLG